MAKEAYMSVATPGTKKVSVCSRRIGTRDRFNVIAVATNEEHAEKIVDALNALQGAVDKIDAPSKRELEVSKGIAVSLQTKLTELSGKLRDEQRKIGEKDRVIQQLEADLRKAHYEAKAAQAVARETA